MKGKNYLNLNESSLLDCVNMMLEKDFKGVKATSIAYMGVNSGGQPFRICLETTATSTEEK